MKKKMLIATLLSSVLALSQPLPVLSAAYAYEELLPETAADLPEHPSGQPMLDCNEVLTVNDEPSMVTITVSGKEDFPPGYTVSMEEPDETEFTETVCRLEDFLDGIQTESQLAFRLMIQDEAGVPAPLHDDYIVRMTMDSIESLSGKNLYHEKQDGTWENIVYTTDIDPETKSPYIEFLTEDPGMFLFVNESIVLTEEDNLDENQEDEVSDMQEETLICQDILYDGQFAEVSVSAEQPFPLDSSLRIQQLPDEILEEKMENLNTFVSADMQLVLPVNLMAVDAAGIEQSLGGNYSVNLMLEDMSVLHGAKLYHELLDGSWEELLFSEASLSCISYASFNGLGNFFFVTGREKEEENENDSLDTSEQPPADEQLSNEDPKEDAEPADEPEAPTVPVEDNSSNETEESVTEKDEPTDDTENTVTDDDTSNKADTVPPKEDGGESQPEKPTDGIEVSEGDDITNGTDPIEDPDDTSDEDGNVLPDENTPSTPEDTEGAADEAEGNVSEENDEILSEETEAGTVEGETDILEDIIPPEEDIREFTYEDDDVIVNARVSSESGIPETAVLFADALEEGSDAYLAAYNEVKDSLVLSEDQKLLFAPYDVYFMNGENRIEPAGGIVQIEMFFKEALFGTSPGSSPTFVTHIRGDGVVEQLENTSDMKDCISFEVSSFSIMGPTMVTNAEEDGTPESREVAPIIIDEYKVRFSSGADLVDDKYIWKPTDPAPGHLFVYRIDYTMSGTFATDKGAFKIELPLHILKDRNGNWADTFDCPYLSEDELTEDMEVPEFVYKIDEANNMAIIYNYKPYPTGEAGYIEFSYATNESTLKYTDMCNSTSVHTKVYATNDASTVTAEADAEPVYVNTHATINYTQKKAPFFYDSWQPAWGEKAPDADEYLYLVWTIRTNINKNTSPYDFYLNDVFTDLNGSVVGYRFAGQTSYSETNHVDGIESYGDRYDYVLTKHSRAEAEKLLEKAGTYEVHNDVTATVSPIDHLDENTSADSSIDWWYEIPEYIRPTGHFWAEKYGVFGEYSIVRDSEDVSDYSLGEFQDNKKSSIDNLKFYTYADAYPYPWTLADGADGTINDVLNGLYGQKKVDYQFTDDTFYLEDSEQALADADYDLTGIEWNPVIRTAEFDKESGGFVEVPTNDYKPEDNITIWVRYGSDWQKAAVYNMQQKSYQDINSTYIKKAFLRKVQFNPGIKGVRFTGSNAYFHTKIDLYPIVSLFNTDAVMDQIGKETGKTKVRLSNEATFEVTQNGSLIFERTVKGKDYIQKVKRESEITKDIIQTFNDKENEKFDVTWLANVEERYTDNDGIHYIYQQSGTFYDLLPAGAVIDVLSVSVNAGKDTLFPGEFDVHTVDNYNHSGRTMLVVTIKEPTESSYTFSYKTIHSYDSIHDYGKNLLNSVAYETGNVDIGEGFPDNGGLISDKDLMADLDKNTDAEKFLYAEARYNINIVVAANTGLRKQIKNSTDTQYSYSTIVHMNENYSYQVRLANDSMTQSKNIVFFDSLENFFQTAEEVDPTIPSDWKGTLTSISVNNLLYKGIQPVIYLSKIDELNLPRHHDLKEVVDGAPVWIEYQEFVDKYGLGAAKAIAVDARKKVDGRNFVLGQNESISFNT